MRIVAFATLPGNQSVVTDTTQGSTLQVRLDPARPAAERVALWRDIMSASGTVEIEDAENFRGSFTSRPLGELRTMRIASSPFRLVRDLAMAERVSRDHVLVNIVKSGTMRGRLAGRALTARAGDLILSRLTNRMDVWLVDADWLALLIPLGVLEQHMAWPRRVDGSVHRAGTLPAELMAGIVRTACAQPGDLPPAEAKRLRMATLSMLAIALDETPTPVTSAAFDREALASAIRSYLVEHLSDPGLGPEAIGAAFGLSRPGVYRALQGSGKGSGDIAAIIRRLRLQAILRDLTSGRHDDEPLAAIARRWGMPEERSFRRAFQQAFGCTPSAVRNGFATPQAAPAIGAELERWFLGL